MIRLTSESFTIDAAQGETARRTISGIAVRYNTPARVSDGSMVAFAPGALPVDGRAPTLQMYHDSSKVIGTVTERVETPEGMLFVAKVSDTLMGSEALVLASDGALSEVSVGVEPIKFKYDKEGTMIVTQASWSELSLVARGAFDAPIQQVAASTPEEEEDTTIQEEPQQETQTMNETVEAPAVIEASKATQTIFATAKREFHMPTPGEYISAFVTNPDKFAEMRAGIEAAAPDVVTTDIPGVLPLPIVQPTYNNFIGRRPVISLVLDDMGRIYANATDNVAADALVAGATVTQNFTAASNGDPSYWASWIATAAQTILSGSNGNLPTHLFLSPNYWGFLLGLSDSSDRPLFPQVGPMNAFGNLAPGQTNGNAFGLSVCVDRNFADGTVVVGDASGFEIFEQQKGAISIDVPSTLSRTIAFRGYLATLMMDETKFVKAALV